jgi:class 3 adenylate cyclase
VETCSICVGGLPRAQRDHARNVVAFAIEAVRVAGETSVSTPGGIQFLQIRAGIHSGSILACVTSSLNPRYSLLGETLQWAQSLEQAAEPMTVKVSAHTHALLQEQCGQAIPAKSCEPTVVTGRGGSLLGVSLLII